MIKRDWILFCFCFFVCVFFLSPNCPDCFLLADILKRSAQQQVLSLMQHKDLTSRLSGESEMCRAHLRHCSEQSAQDREGKLSTNTSMYHSILCLLKILYRRAGNLGKKHS